MTVQDTEAHVPDVYEEVMGVVSVTTLGPHNYCVILDPVGPDGKNQLGQKLVFKVSACPSPRGEWPEAPYPCPFPPPTPHRTHTCISLASKFPLHSSSLYKSQKHLAVDQRLMFLFHTVELSPESGCLATALHEPV